MRYYRLTHRNKTLPNSTIMQDPRTCASESLRRHLLHRYRGLSDNERHVKVDIITDRYGHDTPVGATVWRKLTSERTGLWCVWERVTIQRI